MRMIVSLIFVAGLAASFTAGADDGPRPLQVVFEGCSEFAGVARIPAAGAAAEVPAGYTPLAPDAVSAEFVGRVTRCQGISVDHGPFEPGTLSQLGIGLASPDGTGDINNYTVTYVTNLPRLARRLRAFGLPVVLDPGIQYELTAHGTTLELYAQVLPAFGQPYFFYGTETDPAPGVTQPFLANWWYQGPAGRVRMSTEFPSIGFGTSAVALLTSLESNTGQLTHSNQTQFPLLSVRGVYGTATMTVTVSRD